MIKKINKIQKEEKLTIDEYKTILLALDSSINTEVEFYPRCESAVKEVLEQSIEKKKELKRKIERLIYENIYF